MLSFYVCVCSRRRHHRSLKGSLPPPPPPPQPRFLCCCSPFFFFLLLPPACSLGFDLASASAAVELLMSARGESGTTYCFLDGIRFPDDVGLGRKRAMANASVLPTAHLLEHIIFHPAAAPHYGPSICFSRPVPAGSNSVCCLTACVTEPLLYVGLLGVRASFYDLFSPDYGNSRLLHIYGNCRLDCRAKATALANPACATLAANSIPSSPPLGRRRCSCFCPLLALSSAPAIAAPHLPRVRDVVNSEAPPGCHRGRNYGLPCPWERKRKRESG